MAYSPAARRSALRLVAAQGYAITAGLTGIHEQTLRRWAREAAETDAKRRAWFLAQPSIPHYRQEYPESDIDHKRRSRHARG